MASTRLEASDLKLSICIATFNRAAKIGATLESILSQLTANCEVVVLDGASTDGTEAVVAEYARRCDRLRYIRQEINSGIDRDYDLAVELARGEYCWPMTDDDLLKPGAIAAVLQAIQRDVSLIVVDSEARDLNMSRVLQRSLLNFDSDRVYGPGETDRLFLEVGSELNCNSVVVNRALWLARERKRYYGSLFIYLGVIFQKPLPKGAVVIAEPFIIYRMGNVHTFSPRRTELFFVTWPSVVESLALSESVKRKVGEPWRSPQRLLQLRGFGWYSFAEYQRWVRPQLQSIREMLAPFLVALLPGILVNALFVAYYSIHQRKGHSLQFMRESRFYFRKVTVLRR